jgi:phospholipid transport system substrate-binding protein
MLRRSVLAAVILAAGALVPPHPAAAADPAAFIDNLGNQLQATRNASPPQRFAEFRELLREDFDVPDLGRFVLGRFWRVYTPYEQQEFLGLFENYVVLSYSDRLSEYLADGGVLRVTGSRPDPDGAIVFSQIDRGPWGTGGASARPIEIDWRLTAYNGFYKVSDVVVDGLSMAANGRSELEGVVERNGGEAQAILAVMRQQIASSSR